MFDPVTPVDKGIGNPVIDLLETFKQKSPYFRAYMSRVTGVNKWQIYEIAFGWGGKIWKFMEPNAMYGCAQAIFQSKSPARLHLPILPSDFENTAPKSPPYPVVIHPNY